MQIKKRKRVTTVREHPLRVPVSQKNPTGITIRDKHLRLLKGTYLDFEDIEIVLQGYKSIPLAVRWLFRKRETAMSQLKRDPNSQELILEYKGPLKSKTGLKPKAIDIYTKYYDLLKKK